MRMRMLPASLAAMLLCGAAVAAQQSATDKPGPAPAEQKAAAASVTVTGCVQLESAVVKRNAAVGDVGMSDEFVLTQAALNPGAPADKPATDQPPADAVATAGSAGPGKVYRVTGDREKELKSLVGQRVEITGSFKNTTDEKAELAAIGTSGRTAAGEPTIANTPEITISDFKPLSGACR